MAAVTLNTARESAPFAALPALPDGHGEDAVDRLGREIVLRGVAGQVRGIHDGGAGFLRHCLDGLALVETLGHQPGLLRQALGDLILAPPGGDLIAHLVEVLFARSVDAGHVVPDIAGAGAQGLVVDADIGGEGGFHHRVLLGDVDRVAGLVEAAGIHGRDLDQGQALLLGDISQRLGAGAQILDLVVDPLDLPLGALHGEALAKLRGNLLEGAHGLGLDLGDAHQHRPEPAGDRRARRALLESEGRVGHGLVEHLRLGEGAQIKAPRRDVALGGKRLEGRAFLQLGGRSLGLGRRREGDLLDRAALGRAVPRLLLLVSLAGIRIGHGVRLGKRCRIEGHDADGPVFRRAELAPALVEEALKLFGRGGGDLAGRSLVEQDVGGGAALAGVAMHGLLRGHRHIDVAGDRLGQMQAGHGGALLLHEARLGKADIAQGLIEERPVELAVGALEGRVVHDRGGDELVRDGEAHLLGLLGQDRLGHQVVDHLLVEAERPGLFRGDDGAELAPEALHLVGIGVAHLIDRDAGAAHLRHRRGGRHPEDVADAPDGEADDESAEKDRGDGFADRGLPSLAHVPKHREPVSQKLVKPADKRSAPLRKGQVWLKEGVSLC